MAKSKTQKTPKIQLGRSVVVTMYSYQTGAVIQFSRSHTPQQLCNQMDTHLNIK